MSAANFIAELAEKFDTVIHLTPSNRWHSSAVNTGIRGIIYELDISEWPASGNWFMDCWGGRFDTFKGTHIMLYFEMFLSDVSNMPALLATPNSLFVDRDRRTVYINLPRHPWLYPEYSTSVERVIPFLSSAINPKDPSNNIVRETRAEVRLNIPNFTVRISDNIAGVYLKQGFSITLKNNDGYFDDEERLNIYNTPLYLGKTVKENPDYPDFKRIREGLIESISRNFNDIHINVADRFKALEEDVCTVVKQTDFDFTVADGALNSFIPLVYGTRKIVLTRLDETRYMTAENAGQVLDVFDRNGEPVTVFSFDPGTKVLTVPDIPMLDDDGNVVIDNQGEVRYVRQNPREALVRGSLNNRIGEVIRDILLNRAKIPETDNNFNLEEFGTYADNSPRVNFAVTGGSIRAAIEDVIKNDTAFFIQDTKGRFTVRTYGGTYDIREAANFHITQSPEMSDGNAHENYFSSCIINYVADNGDELSFLFDERESDAERRYRRRVRKTFFTDLTSETDARLLAETLSDRYTYRRHSLRLAVGVDTSDFQLMDRVKADIHVNDRIFSKYTDFLITGINHSQDILYLEEI